MAECPRCGGDGKINCSRCDGKGEVTVTDVFTVLDLTNVGNSDTITCPKCEGTGSEDCPRCDGTGEVHS
jgi:RecJ-like exonuclease